MNADANDNVDIDNAINVVNRSIPISPILLLVKTKNELPGYLLLLLLLLVVITVTTIPLSTQQVNGVDIKKTTTSSSDWRTMLACRMSLLSSRLLERVDDEDLFLDLRLPK